MVPATQITSRESLALEDRRAGGSFVFVALVSIVSLLSSGCVDAARLDLVVILRGSLAEIVRYSGCGPIGERVALEPAQGAGEIVAVGYHAGSGILLARKDAVSLFDPSGKLVSSWPLRVSLVAWSNTGDRVAALQQSDKSVEILILDREMRVLQRLSVGAPSPGVYWTTLNWSADDAMVAISGADKSGHAMIARLADSKVRGVPFDRIFFVGADKFAATRLTQRNETFVVRFSADGEYAIERQLGGIEIVASDAVAGVFLGNHSWVRFPWYFPPSHLICSLYAIDGSLPVWCGARLDRDGDLFLRRHR